MIEVKGKGGISAKIIADSISERGNRITTYELEYPRFIHAEFMTHRAFSRNAASSRAIPVTRSIELIKERTAMPIHWGKNQPGMSAKEECNENVYIDFGSISDYATKEQAWNFARNCAIEVAEAFNDAGYHKQIVNRLLEPFSFIKVVCTATEFDNFFYLRCHPDAQPEIQELARCMFDARQISDPFELIHGAWHTPYYANGYWSPEFTHIDEDTPHLSLQDALAVSASCCAQVSYRRLDDSIEKAQDIFKRLIESKPAHASPMEHQASPMRFTIHERGASLEEGISHIDRVGSYWSNNFKGWIQHRALIPDSTCFKFEKEQP